MTRKALWMTTMGLLWMCVAAIAAPVSQVHLGWSENDVHTTMTVMWYSADGGAFSVAYDRSTHPGSGDADAYAWKTAGNAATIHPALAPDGTLVATTAFNGTYYRAELVGLEAGEEYYFRIVDNATADTTEEWWFRTIGDAQEVRFTFAGDSQRPYETPEGEMGQLMLTPAAPANWPMMRNFITLAVAGQRPDFMLALGDFVSRGNSQDQWTHWFEAWERLAVTDGGRMIPIVPVVGNHDVSGYPDVDASYEWFLGMFAIPQPLPGVPCYALDFPNLHLAVLSATSEQVASNRAKAIHEAGRQADWLLSDLAAATAPWKVAAFHYNMVGCFDACTGYPSDSYMKAWTPALEQQNVDMVLMGHTHNYTRTWPVDLALDGACGVGGFGAQLQQESENGITYITSGTWGAAATPIVAGTACELRKWIAAAAAHPGYGVARVTENTLGVVMTDTAGALLDSFVLPYTASEFPVPEYRLTVP